MSKRESGLQPVKPVQPIAGWRGGKRLLARRIIERIEAVPHECYAEPFTGMAGVFLRRPSRPKSEILNDINGEIVNLFRVIREHPDELARQFDWMVAARNEFARLLSVPAETLTDVQRAARFAYIQRQTYGSLPANNAIAANFAVESRKAARISASAMIKRIRAVHGRLQGVQVECLDWATFIPRYDRPFTLFYVDPPYWGFEDDYGKGLFAREDYGRMAEILGALKGRFIMSINDRPETRETFAAFQIEAVQTRWTTSGKTQKKAGELLISGP